MRKKYPWFFFDNFSNLEAALRPIIEELGGRMPTDNEFRSRGQSRLSRAVTKLGGAAVVAKMLGVGTVKLRLPKKRYADFENVKIALVPIVEELGGKMPTLRELRNRNQSTLSEAITRFGGTAVVARRLGISTNGIITPKNHYDDLENMRAELLPIVEELGGRMPSDHELRVRDRRSLSRAISKHGGKAAVAARLGLSISGGHPPNHWKNFDNLKNALMPVIAQLGKMPTHRTLVAKKLAALSTAIVAYHGGYTAVTRRLGLDPVAQETIEERADRVARAYLALELEDDGTALWNAMARRWLARDLDAALAAFEEDGTLDAFRGLLADP